jgi:hypothetical protein
MDPEAALASAEYQMAWILEALTREDSESRRVGIRERRSRIREYLAAYTGWRRGGGFEPNNGDARARAISRFLRSGGKAGAWHIKATQNRSSASRFDRKQASRRKARKTGVGVAKHEARDARHTAQTIWDSGVKQGLDPRDLTDQQIRALADMIGVRGDVRLANVVSAYKRKAGSANRAGSKRAAKAKPKSLRAEYEASKRDYRAKGRALAASKSKPKALRADYEASQRDYRAKGEALAASRK